MGMWHGLHLAASRWFYDSGTTPPVPIVDNAWNLYCFAMGPCDGTYRLNGQALFTGPPPSVVGAFNGLAINRGADSATSFPQDASGFSLGDFMVWNRRLATSELEQVEGYMAWAYGLASTTALISSHVYKAARPLVVSQSPSPSSSVTPGPQNNFNVPLKPGFVAFTSTVAGTGTATYRSADDGSPARLAQLNEPWGLAWDSANQRLFVSQHGDHRVRAIDRNGMISTYAFSGTAGSMDSTNPLAATINGPMGMAYEPSTGALFVCEFLSHRIRVVYSNGACLAPPMST